MPRMIGDFNDNANALWSLHLDEAKSHDEARIHSLKDDMDSVLIFVRLLKKIPSSSSTPSSCTGDQAGLFSAALTSFLVDRIHDLQVDPAQQMVYYQQQNVALLAQISKQVSSLAPQVSIPSILPPSYPTFKPNSSDVRVNAFWFMSLIFSLSAALIATLVQQWVRDYMHVFQRYSNPLKSARLRQYLYEGAEGWYMPMVAESVPGLVHVSLFLFFVGLGDSLLSVNTTVGVTTILPITACGLLYILSMFAPIINPQSPFQNTFSGLVWYLRQKLHPRRYLDRASGGSLKAVSSNLSDGQIQLAMEENDERKDRDVRAIQWLIHNRTEDDEMESFVMAIPGSFTSKWGIDVWRTVSGATQLEGTNFRPNGPTVRSQSEDLPTAILPHHHSPLSQSTHHPLGLLHSFGRFIGIRIANGTPRNVTATQSMPRFPGDGQALNDHSAHGDLAIFDLCKRIRHLVDTCNNYSIFTNEALWLKRARGCVETAASLVVCADIKPELFGDIGRLRPPLFKFAGRHHTEPGSDGLFFARLDCLTFVIVHRGMANDDVIKLNASVAINALSRFGTEDDSEQTTDGNNDEGALRNARRIDEDFETAREFCVYGLRAAFRPSGEGTTEERVREVLARDHVTDVSVLERIALAVDELANIDRVISRINYSIFGFSDGLIQYVRGVYFDDFEQTALLQPIRFFNHPNDTITDFFPLFIFLGQRLQLLCSYSSKLRDIIDGEGNSAYQDILESLETLWSSRKSSGVRQRHLMERQLWRLQDLRDGGGFGFWVELFFLAAIQLLTITLSPDAHTSLIVGTFRVITSNWRQYKNSIGTQRVILNLVCDIAIPGRGPIYNYDLPRFITDDLLVLLKHMTEGQSGSHIHDAMKELDDASNKEDTHPASVWWTNVPLFREEAVKILLKCAAFTRTDRD